jgi:hypothetical protein
MRFIFKNIYFKPYLHVIFFFSSHLIVGQLPNETPISILLDSLENQIIYQTDQSFRFIDLNSFKTKKTIQIPKQTISNLIPVINKDELYLISNNSGNTYVLGKDDGLKRIDNSGIQNFFNNSAVFVKNDTIFRHGGYGYWTSSNFMIYFDDSTKQWEVYPTSKNSKTPRGADSHVSTLTSNNYVFFGGYTVSENGYRSKTPLNTEVWCYDFEIRDWNILGNMIPNQFDDVAGSFTAYNQVYFFDKKSNFFRLDIFGNKLTKYKRNPIVYDFYRISPIFYKNYLYYVNSSGELSNILFTDLTSSIEKTIRFYENRSRIKNTSYVIIVLLLFLLTMFFIHKRTNRLRKLLFLENGIKYRGKYVELDPMAISIIQYAFKGDVPFSIISNMLNKPHLSKIQNERIKNKMITEINLKLHVLTGISQDFLVVSKSSYDARYKVVHINHIAFEKII